MSVNFQNADPIKQALYEELQKLLSHDTDLRTSAEIRMKQLGFTEGNFKAWVGLIALIENVN